MGFSVVSGGRVVAPGLDEGWNALMARALDPGRIRGPLGEAITVFAEIFAGHLSEPANARRWCVSFSGAFVSVCTYRHVQADTVDGFLPVPIPPLSQETAVHTAVQAAAAQGQPDGAGELIIDWTGRQFDPTCPVPLLVTPAGWRAFWHESPRKRWTTLPERDIGPHSEYRG